MEELLNYLKDKETKHRATRLTLRKEGKSYRSYAIAFENGYLNALADIITILEQPEREQLLHEAMVKLIKREEG